MTFSISDTAKKVAALEKQLIRQKEINDTLSRQLNVEVEARKKMEMEYFDDIDRMISQSSSRKRHDQAGSSRLAYRPKNAARQPEARIDRSVLNRLDSRKNQQPSGNSSAFLLASGRRRRQTEEEEEIISFY